ncbi:hypothetical protein K440DRAFT_637331 [Wilcoxina mikolae CBS 423.85]|nr:hypothetical protein K440DRAFT_637331 [Wilcoxina mikolae CBS 423.85]
MLLRSQFQLHILSLLGGWATFWEFYISDRLTAHTEIVHLGTSENAGFSYSQSSISLTFTTGFDCFAGNSFIGVESTTDISSRYNWIEVLLKTLASGNEILRKGDNDGQRCIQCQEGGATFDALNHLMDEHMVFMGLGTAASAKKAIDSTACIL